jgi:Rps23 Pro-64 3,4-dihydroxylase Tpa1-like proline 4-hydroxylase
MTPDWDTSWGGGLEFWSHDEETQQPKECVTKIENKFNRAVLFDTTQNSWHGLPEELTCPEHIARRSLATYYLSYVNSKAESRKRALYAPYKDQNNDPSVIEFCKKRSQ